MDSSRRLSLKDVNHENLFAGILAAIFIITGPSALILEASANGNFTLDQTIFWIMSVYVFGGLFGIILSLHYRMPIVGGHSLTGVAFLAVMTAQFSYQELIGAYILSGILLFLSGILGFFSKWMSWVPREIISAMLAGMITKYMIQFVLSISELLFVGAASLAVYLILVKWKTKIPPVIGAIATGCIALALTGSISAGGGWNAGPVIPEIQEPGFSVASFLSIAIPLALLILSNDVAVAAGALEQNRYRAPINRILSVSGVFSVVASFFGGQSANIAGMATLICSGPEAGPKEKRYFGAFISGVLLVLFGVFSFSIIPLIHILPKDFISIVVGFSLLALFGQSIQQGFSNPRLQVGATLAFIISLSNITILNISAPVWSLLIGALTARYIEKAQK